MKGETLRLPCVETFSAGAKKCKPGSTSGLNRTIEVSKVCSALGALCPCKGAECAKSGESTQHASSCNYMNMKWQDDGYAEGRTGCDKGLPMCGKAGTAAAQKDKEEDIKCCPMQAAGCVPLCLDDSCGPPTQWSLLFSYVLWLYCGFYSLGSLAGEIEDPKRTYSIALVILIPMVVLLNVLPIAVSIATDPTRSNYKPGHFTVVAEHICGWWMRYLFFGASQVSLLGLYNRCVPGCPACPLQSSKLTSDPPRLN